MPGKQSSDGRFTGPCSIAKRWTPYEISIVSVPADPTVGVGAITAVTIAAAIAAVTIAAIIIIFCAASLSGRSRACVSVPADPTVGVGRSDDGGTLRQLQNKKLKEESKMTPTPG